MALSDGFCVLVRTCTLVTFPESLKHILARYDVVKLGVAIGEDGRKVNTTTRRYQLSVAQWLA